MKPVIPGNFLWSFSYPLIIWTVVIVHFWELPLLLMKLTAAIFASLIFLLTVHPLFSSKTTVKEDSSCCKKIKDAKSKSCNNPLSNPADDCKQCNPFMACSVCGFVGAENDLNLASPVREVSKTQIGFIQSYSSSYLSDCFRPPKTPII